MDKNDDGVARSSDSEGEVKTVTDSAVTRPGRGDAGDSDSCDL